MQKKKQPLYVSENMTREDISLFLIGVSLSAEELFHFNILRQPRLWWEESSMSRALAHRGCNGETLLGHCTGLHPRGRHVK